MDVHTREEEALCKSCMGIKQFLNMPCFILIFLGFIMTVFLIEHTLLVKLFNERKVNISATVREFCRINKLCYGQMSMKHVRAMISRFEETKNLGV